MIPSKAQMYNALVQRQGQKLVDKLQNATVAVCGLGGLGSNIAISLARSGVGKLVIIDFDKVDVTNLHRQQYRANQIGMYKADALNIILDDIAPYTKIEKHIVKLDETNMLNLLDNADIICEAFDDAYQKAMITNFVLENMPDKYIVAASGMAGVGTPNAIKTRRVTSKFYICGDEKSDVCDDIGLVAARVMLCAAHQAQTVLRIIDDKFDC